MTLRTRAVFVSLTERAQVVLMPSVRNANIVCTRLEQLQQRDVVIPMAPQTVREVFLRTRAILRLQREPTPPAATTALVFPAQPAQPARSIQPRMWAIRQRFVAMPAITPADNWLPRAVATAVEWRHHRGRRRHLLLAVTRHEVYHAYLGALRL